MIVLYDAIAKLLLNLVCLWAAASLSVAIKYASVATAEMGRLW